MISRVADHCFWLGRYVERAEATARVLVVTGNLALDTELTRRAAWMPVVVVAGEGPRFVERFGEDAADDGELVQRFMTWDEENWSCLYHSIRAARDNARSIREVVSLEVWETLNELWIWLRSDAARADWESQRHAFYRRIRASMAQVAGLVDATMLDDAPRDFIRLGVMLERCGQTARLLDVHHHVLRQMEASQRVVETPLWLALLRACSGFESFMKRHRGEINGAAVAAFLLLDVAFPRSIRHCVRETKIAFERIRPSDQPGLPGAATLERIERLERWTAGLRPSDVKAETIHEQLTLVVDETSRICDGLGTELLGRSVVAEVPAAAQ